MTNEDAVVVSDGLFAVGRRDWRPSRRRRRQQTRPGNTRRRLRRRPHRVKLLCRFACQEANRAVWGQANGQDNIMGTTLVALAMTSDAAGIVLHAGDSRLYRLRNGRLEQLTHDHTIIADLLRNGELSEEDARTHPHRFVLTRATRRIPTCRRRSRWGFLRTRRSAVALQRRPASKILYP